MSDISNVFSTDRFQLCRLNKSSINTFTGWSARVRERETGFSASVKRREFGDLSHFPRFLVTKYSCMQFCRLQRAIFASKGDKRCAFPSKRKRKDSIGWEKEGKNSHYEQVSPGERFKSTIIVFAPRLEWIKHIAIWCDLQRCCRFIYLFILKKNVPYT